MQDHSEIERTSSHRPFDAFPPELLAACFLALKEALTEDRGSGEYRLYRWISVTLVCRHWRDVALSSSTLWTGVSTRYGLEAVRKLLLLSKAALLSVLVRPSPGTPRQETEKVLRLIQTHAHRIQNLVVIVGRELDPFTVIDLRSCGRLNMILVNSMGMPASTRSLGGIAEPPNPPPVKDLILDGCHVPWYPWILTGLTRLDIRFARSSGIPTVKAIFAILGHCAALQFLTLSGFVDGVDREVETLPVKKLTLPHLAGIIIKKMTAHQCALFFNYLSLPENVSWLVTVTDYDRDSDADAMCLPSPPSKFESLVVKAKLGTAALTVSGRCVSTPIDPAALTSALTFTSAERAPLIYLDLLKAFDMAGWSNMTIFTFEYNQKAFCTVDGESAWSHLLFRLPELKALQVVFTDIDIDDALTAGLALLSALSPPRLAPDDEFPAEEADVDWDAESICSADSYGDLLSDELARLHRRLLPCLSAFTLRVEQIERCGPGTSFWHRLMDFLKLRDQHGRRLEKVDLKPVKSGQRVTGLAGLDEARKYVDLFEYGV